MTFTNRQLVLICWTATVLSTTGSSGIHHSRVQPELECYLCTGINGVDACGYPFNHEGPGVSKTKCRGRCISVISYGPAQAGSIHYEDKVTRGCTMTEPETGCWRTPESTNLDVVTCVELCAHDLCNAAVGRHRLVAESSPPLLLLLMLVTCAVVLVFAAFPQFS